MRLGLDGLGAMGGEEEGTDRASGREVSEYRGVSGGLLRA